jgi:hypothetical protein
MKAVKSTFYFLLIVSFLAQAAFAQEFQKDYVKGELLVKYKNGAANTSVVETNNRIGAAVVEQFSRFRVAENKTSGRFECQSSPLAIQKFS